MQRKKRKNDESQKAKKAFLMECRIKDEVLKGRKKG
jgi:hypothetical protein